MQAIFTDIVDGEEEKVLERIRKDSGALSVVATGRPKKYAGQSPLQVAIRSGAFRIAELLVSRGADSNFVDRSERRRPARRRSAARVSSRRVLRR